MEEVKQMNIYEKMLMIASEIDRVKKNSSVGEGRTAYKAVSEVDVLNAVKDIEAKYRVFSFPAFRKIVDSQLIETEKPDYKTGELVKSSKFYMRIETIYHFVNIDNTNEMVEVISYGDGIDTQDKACGKAMTYSDKYALMKAYKIETGDDPDKDASPDEQKITKKAALKKAVALKPEDKITFGKYTGKTYQEIFEIDAKYFEWIINSLKQKMNLAQAEEYAKLYQVLQDNALGLGGENNEQSIFN